MGGGCCRSVAGFSARAGLMETCSAESHRSVARSRRALCADPYAAFELSLFGCVNRRSETRLISAASTAISTGLAT
jgi:hypothetical protein